MGLRLQLAVDNRYDYTYQCIFDPFPFARKCVIFSRPSRTVPPVAPFSRVARREHLKRYIQSYGIHKYTHRIMFIYTECSVVLYIRGNSRDDSM